MTRVIKEWRVQTGVTPDGRKEETVIGWEVEDDFGGGHVTTRLKLDLSHFSPQLFALVRGVQEKRSAFAYATRHDFAKRYKDPSAPEIDEAMPADAGPSEWNGGGK